jgi:PPM family protein phosphatase
VFVKCRTDIGKVRDVNEDYVLSLKGNKYWLLLVADGMGGHNAGEIASKIAATTVRNFVYENFSLYEDKEELIRDAIVISNSEVYNESVKLSEFKGMGTTVTCCVIYDQKLFIGHVGDSRAYILSEDNIRKITQDHSYVQELINNGSITENEAFNHPRRNLITRAIGTEKHVVVDTLTLDFNNKDIILLCSDGLTTYVNSDELYDIIMSLRENSIERLIEMAKDRGGRDNISIIIAGKGEKDE